MDADSIRAELAAMMTTALPRFRLSRDEVQILYDALCHNARMRTALDYIKRTSIHTGIVEAATDGLKVACGTPSTSLAARLHDLRCAHERLQRRVQKAADLIATQCADKEVNPGCNCHLCVAERLLTGDSEQE